MANDDTPELGRLVVIHHALLASIFSADTWQLDEGEVAMMKEADALVMRIAHRSRSAQNYQNTLRGEAALDDAKQIVDALNAGDVLHTMNDRQKVDSTYVEIVNMVWDKDQLDNPVMPGDKPRREIVRRWYVDPDLRFLSPELQRTPGADNADDS